MAHLSDEQIREGIRQTAPPVTARRILAANRALYGTPGGKNHVYRVWSSMKAEAVPPAPAVEFRMRNQELPEPDRIALQIENDQLRARAELAEERERAHLEKWAKEIDRLRQAQFQNRRSAGGEGVSADKYLAVHRDLQRTRQRADLYERVLVSHGVNVEKLLEALE